MPVAHHINFKKTDTPINTPTTKFGGQPVWVDTPAWPVSRTLEEPMQFIGQIALDVLGLPDSYPQMAYIFMADDEAVLDEPWAPDSGGNCVLLQPSTANPIVKTITIKTGPTLTEFEDVQGFLRKKRVAVPCEYEAQLLDAKDPDYCSPDDLLKLSDEIQEAHHGAALVNKIGGSPYFLQGEEFPPGGPDKWRLILQLDSAQIPFDVNFGDVGVGYAFISNDGSEARFLWQCM